ncbi:hypothetical protein KIN20_021398 [Parelaphostrongylus tenuis]|uniref:Uncharacterized protein n=1 Tax=Parelaphostrongylus tenuis TaxID=148309 RepID=A0AAD5QUJ8_PARTN|nr:hypothetical protein KIN20_021398 [Parelaphostrongylus tenuis]
MATLGQVSFILSEDSWLTVAELHTRMMKVVLLALIASTVGSGATESLETGSGETISEDGFKKILEKGYSILKNEQNIVATKRLLD